MRAYRRQAFKIGTICLVLMMGLLLFTYSYQREVDRAITIKIMEESIQSPINQVACHQPNLPIDNPEVMKFYSEEPKLDCGNAEDEWVMCDRSICFVKPEIVSRYEKKNVMISCSYTDLIRKTDFKNEYGNTTKTTNPYMLKESDFVRVSCRAENKLTWAGIVCGIRDVIPKKRFEKLYLESYPSPYNVLIFGFDSLSRNAFIRKLPRTYDFLTKQLDAIVLEGYNIVGDGTPQALIPILTGYTELDLPDTRRRMHNANHVNVYPMIWKDYEAWGYYTSFNEDCPETGIFTYRLRGFDEQPVDHYMRNFYVEIKNNWTKQKPNCVGNQPDHVIMLDYTKNFMLKYRASPRFIFSFHGGLSHDSTNLVGTADEDVLHWLNNLRENALLEDTILIMMSDHGARFSHVRATLQGKQEERLPFFSFAFPKSFKERFPNEYANFVANAKHLTTPFDIHATLKDILKVQINNEPIPLLTEGWKIHVSEIAEKRAISLFKHIPANRSCADAYIEPHWCACLNWHPLPLNDNSHTGLLLTLADSIIQTINTATENYRQLCAKLQLDHINWAMHLLPRKDLIRFERTNDADGFLPKLKNPEEEPKQSLRIREKFYQLQIVVNPGQSLFEASIKYDLETQTASTKLSEISRINRYGSQANCIYQRDPELRKLCYCNNF